MLWQKLLYMLVITKDDSGQLSYCPLIWTFSSRQSNYLINKPQEQALRVTYNDCGSSFFELLEMSNESTIPIKA